MSPLNRGVYMEYPSHRPRVPPTGLRPHPPRFGGRFMPPAGIPPPRFSPGTLRPLPPPRPDGVSLPNGMLPPMFPAGPRPRGVPIAPPMGPRGSGIPRGLPMRPWPRRMPPPPLPPLPRFRFNAGNGIAKGKSMSVTKKVAKQEEIELKKPWMTDEIRNEIQKKNKLYVKAKKSKSVAEWEEFKDVRNKVTRMIRDAKNEYLSRHPEQAHLYSIDEEPYDQRDENCASSDDDDDDKPHYCEVCDRDFPSEELFARHKSEHALCGIDGCTFSAHPLLVEKHINMQHRSGLYERMKNLATPEGIEEWIAERKRRYPTEANRKLREAEELEKLQRGEIIKQFSSNVRAKRTPINAREKKRKPRKRRAREVINNYALTDEVYRGVRPFRGTSVLEEDEEEDNGVCLEENEMKQNNVSEGISGIISDEDDIPQTPVKEEPADLPTTTLSALSSLVANYGTDDDDDNDDNDERPEEVPIKIIKMEDDQDNKVTENIGNKETLSVESCTDTGNKSNERANKNIARERQDKQNHETERIQVAQQKRGRMLDRYHNRLLEKLLARDIQHERNLICQCIKYIIDNNFFDSNNVQNNKISR